MKKRLIIVDISNFIFRAFYAIKPMNAPDGTPTNAVHGVLSMLLKLFSDYRPTHILVAKDTPGGSFRNNIYSDYKANRTEPPEELARQFPLISSLLEQMKLSCSFNDIYEADDIIGSAVYKWKGDVDEIFIASGDKDLMQLVGGPVVMLDTMKNKIYDEKGVFEKMGVWPSQIVDYLAMVGDRSDNVPGIKGIGAKGASKLLAEHGPLEKCIEMKSVFKGKVLTRAFGEYAHQGLLSKKLVKIVTNVDMNMSLEDTEYCFYPDDSLLHFLASLGFKTIPKRLREQREQNDREEGGESEGSFMVLNEEKHLKRSTLVIVEDESSLKELLALIESCANLSFYTEFDSDDICGRTLIGVGISFDGKKSFYCPMLLGKITASQGRELLKACWSNENLEVFSDHIQRDISFALNQGLDFKAQTFDVSQAFYNVRSSSENSLEEMTRQLLDETLPAWNRKKEYEKITDSAFASLYFCERAVALYELAEILKEDLKKQSLENIYYNIDDKLIPVLARMENHGIGVDIAFFRDFEREIQSLLENLERKIFSYNGDEPLNLNSPKQVGEFLFDRLGLFPIKETKTGLSTDSEVLMELAARGNSPVPDLLIQYRELGKLLSTYVSVIPKLVNARTGRVHSHFNQNIATTGRLSSTHPNLQNIPIRSEMGRKVRKGLVAGKGCVFLGADYSQVELRILASLSGDETMGEAFREGRDIHAQTASEVLGVDISTIDSRDRSNAKAVNFGLIYGQSSFGLAKNLRISRREAKEYITKYFGRFGRVKAFLDGLKEECARRGFVQTYHGRKRFLPDIYSKNRVERANAERMAVNGPIQGTAADIIKKAMIDIDERIRKGGLDSKMILQIHDELIFEVPHREVDTLRPMVVEVMEGVEASLALKVTVGVAPNWFDLK